MLSLDKVFSAMRLFNPVHGSSGSIAELNTLGGACGCSSSDVISASESRVLSWAGDCFVVGVPFGTGLGVMLPPSSRGIGALCCSTRRLSRTSAKSHVSAAVRGGEHSWAFTNPGLKSLQMTSLWTSRRTDGGDVADDTRLRTHTTFRLLSIATQFASSTLVTC